MIYAMSKFTGSLIPWLTAALLLLQAGCGPGQPALRKAASPPNDKLSTILARGILVIATDADYPPQSRLIPGVGRDASTRCAPNQYSANQMEGYDIETAVEISRRLRVEACFVTPAWTQIIGGGWDDRWDVSIGSMVITRERMQSLYFTQPYISGAAVLFVHKDNHTFSGPVDLSGKRIGVCAGCAYESFLKGTLDIPGETINLPIKDAVVVAYDTDTSALADLAQGDGVQVDAVLTDPDTGRIAIDNGLPIRQLGEPLYHDYSAAAIDKKSGKDPLALVDRITAIITEMHQDGTLLKFSTEVYHGDFTTPAARFDINALGQFSSPKGKAP